MVLPNGWLLGLKVQQYWHDCEYESIWSRLDNFLKGKSNKYCNGNLKSQLSYKTSVKTLSKYTNFVNML